MSKEMLTNIFVSLEAIWVQWACYGEPGKYPSTTY